jgi:hypothetical protein
MKILVLFAVVAWCHAYEVSIDGGTQVVYEQQPQVITYEQQQPQVIYEQRQPQVLIQQPPVVYQPAVQAKNCPIACPYGWNKWGPFTKNCYLMPAQPLHLDTFWKQYEHCKRQEPTSYPLVINDVVEQALGTAVALQYAPSYAVALSNAHLWLGGFVDPRTGNWAMADGSTPNPIGMITVKVTGTRNGLCISADPKTVGIWTARDCKDDTGAVICEMAPRPVCNGRTGGMLPISPIGIDKILSGKDIIPKMPSIPIFGQVLGGGNLLGLGGKE